MSHSYKYSKNVNNVLTDAQQRFYDHNGFVVIKNNVGHELLDEMIRRFIDICNGKVETGFMTIMKDVTLRNKGVKGEYLINKIQDFLYDDVLFKYTSDTNVIKIVESIIGPNITAIHSMLINKPPNAGVEFSHHPLHQDLHYFPLRPANEIVASWTAIEKINKANGGLFVVPGSHKGFLMPHTYPEGVKNKLYHGVYGLDHLPRIDLEMEKGDTVFFHPLLLHGSGPNTTNGFRKAISCHYASSDCYVVEVEGTLQENIAKEVEGLMARRGLPLNYVELWKAKSRLVKGSPVTFEKHNHHL